MKIRPICGRCGLEKSRMDFYLDRRKSNGLYSICKECCKIRAQENWAKCDKKERTRVHRAWVAKNRDHIRAYKVANALHVPIQAIERLLAIGKCAICGSALNLGIDHDHTRNILRGLLCDLCNTGIGLFHDNPELLIRAARYLKPDIFKTTYEAVGPEEGALKK